MNVFESNVRRTELTGWRQDKEIDSDRLTRSQADWTGVAGAKVEQTQVRSPEPRQRCSSHDLNCLSTGVEL